MIKIWAGLPDYRKSFYQTKTSSGSVNLLQKFGAYEGKTYDLLMYVVDNEIHHRGQGYVYLRTLGIEPPPFYER